MMQIPPESGFFWHFKPQLSQLKEAKSLLQLPHKMVAIAAKAACRWFRSARAS
jgi:hypothetical protein